MESGVSSCSIPSLRICYLFINYHSPKHLGYGIAAGVTNVVAGAVGAVGLVVLFPVSCEKMFQPRFIPLTTTR